MLPTATSYRHIQLEYCGQQLEHYCTSSATGDKCQLCGYGGQDQHLEGYDLVVFLSTAREVLDDTGKTAFQNHLNKVSNMLNTTIYGRHSELDIFPDAYFDYHPESQNATIVVLDASRPSTKSLPTDWPARCRTVELSQW
ncbi:uncharacterized protein BT62DRAFT_1071653 [Guyanagaster necrorhizus]|uniref:ThuA-like domain-containing protein n=1 Tax=Guyanagaster necrorhizus TaxID=856835 RepID=A0A9P8AX51_9AGAR|nr:uncharacterized protein BT62DRAFT_1071653 [Guyanagaster necrorhizus MCA 3950]KAG7451055.1 hypothetical protein BT62DRAFT_1071653 [Guyanagaster necrorhizus MCA 3950]